MPTYAYRCKSCGHELEELQRITDEPLVTCPKCQKPTLVRSIGGGAGLHFKGSGFYLTDYRKKTSSDTSTKKSEPKKDPKPPSSTPPASDSPPKP